MKKTTLNDHEKKILLKITYEMEEKGLNKTTNIPLLFEQNTGRKLSYIVLNKRLKEINATRENKNRKTSKPSYKENRKYEKKKNNQQLFRTSQLNQAVKISKIIKVNNLYLLCCFI